MAIRGYRTELGDDERTEFVRPVYDYDTVQPGADFTYGGRSGPLSGGDSGGGAANQPTTMNAWDYNLPSTSPYSDPKTARNFNPPVTNPYESHNQPPAWDPKTADAMWDKLDDQVYNAATNKWEHSGDWSYPGSKLFPERMGMIDNLLTFGTTNPADGLDYKNIAQDLANRQQRTGDLAHAWVNNPNMSHQDYDNLIHHDFTGFDSQGNFNPLPGSDVFSNLNEDMQHHFQVTNDPFASGAFGDAGYNEPTPTHTGSVFDEGGIFSSSFWKNKGGPVSGGK
mgnify:CR=1 FL=1